MKFAGLFEIEKLVWVCPGQMLRLRKLKKATDMPTIKKTVKSGVNGASGQKPQIRGRHKNGFVHVISPATFSQIRRAAGIKPSHISNVRRAFEEAGVKV